MVRIIEHVNDAEDDDEDSPIWWLITCDLWLLMNMIMITVKVT